METSPLCLTVVIAMPALYCNCNILIFLLKSETTQISHSDQIVFFLCQIMQEMYTTQITEMPPPLHIKYEISQFL